MASGHTSLHILYEDNHLLVVNKPAMLPTMGVREGRPSLLDEAKAYIRRRYEKPAGVFLGVVSRLDAPVTGVVLFARTSKAASRLAKQFRERQVHKVYLAIVAGRVAPAEGQLVDHLRKHERHRKVLIAAPGSARALEGRLSYKTLESQPHESLLEVCPETGRKHQIRVQLAHLGHPILGDRKYGSTRPFPRGIALHSRRLIVQHPVRGEAIELAAPLPAAWRGRVGVDKL